jgi:hypothetical protein
LWAVPLVPAVLALLCAVAARGDGEAEASALLRRQLQADAELLQEAGRA